MANYSLRSYLLKLGIFLLSLSIAFYLDEFLKSAWMGFAIVGTIIIIIGLIVLLIKKDTTSPLAIEDNK